MRNVMLITGASRGIGAATALLAAERGYAVVLNYLRNREAAEALRQRIERQGGEALAVAADVAEEGDVERLFAAIDERFGRLDVLVNNAGMLEAQTRLENIDAARLHRVFATNVTGSFLCAREAVKRLSTPATAGAAAASSTCPRWPRGWDRPTNTSTMPPPRAPSTA
ncbi:Glucose 1-dehydrogenase B [Pseudomonas aeruginosa]|nr:Glucose 1-dehydrogenase B [Pseudomonas aeruginosa]